jgi:hypothetical protein
MGIKWRFIGVLCGMIPILNLIVFTRIINITLDEVDFEIEKEVISNSPTLSDSCKTKFPLVLVHGVFFVIASCLTIGVESRRRSNYTVQLSTMANINLR